MKKILLEIDDEIFSSLESALNVKKLVDGFGGILDNFLLLLLNAIAEKKEKITISKK